ncbi:MAG: FkbM family methyltransferase [Bacteroidetes bacterium]|jgi:FkbM family methyltransferase|nr:FkbM family methyltransferase [Bacteroidota bacterium]MBT6686484.1 FkbM family methyltransferase [Bacteroidota bacterium]MBT7142713.1 FkbM family methyltransferase [Bacteroidota bacterium]MBT7491165.1 FkbM family methyltransferase [Bacteroidota bacterium]
MKELKRIFKRNTHNSFFKQLAGFGRALNRLYENRNHDVYSNGELTVLKKISKFNPAVIIDGGANIGNYSLLLREYNPQSKIFAFEPVVDTFNQLKNKVGEQKNIVPINKGLFSETCSKEINIFNSHTHSSIYDIKGISYQSTDLQSIELTSGDDFAIEQGLDEIDFVKLDLEGAEYDAIVGFRNLLERKRIKVIQFEYGYINISTKKLLIDFYTLLNEFGYLVGKIFPKIVEFRDYNFMHEDFIGPNFIAVNKNEKELIESFKKK